MAMMKIQRAVPLAAVVAGLLLHCANAFNHVLIYSPSCNNEVVVEYKVERHNEALHNPAPTEFARPDTNDQDGYFGMYAAAENKDKIVLRVKDGDRQEMGTYEVIADRPGQQADLTVAGVRFEVFVHDVQPGGIWQSTIKALAAKRDAGSQSDTAVKEQVRTVFEEQLAAAGKFFVLVFVDGVKGEYVTIKYSGDETHEAMEQRRALTEKAMFSAVNFPASDGSVTVKTSGGEEATVALATDMFSRVQFDEDGGRVYILVTKSRNHFDKAWRQVHKFHNTPSGDSHPYWNFDGEWKDAELKKLVDMEMEGGVNPAVSPNDQLDADPLEDEGRGKGKILVVAIIIAALIAAAAYYFCCGSIEDMVVSDRSCEEQSEEITAEPSMHGEHWPVESVRILELPLRQEELGTDAAPATEAV